jgi:hypothetical protein
MYCLKAFVANELLQKEKGNLQEELEIIESKYSKVSAELLSTLQKLSMLETEKKVSVLYISCGSEMVRHKQEIVSNNSG